MANELSEKILAMTPCFMPTGGHLVGDLGVGWRAARDQAADLAASAPLFNWRRVEDEEGDGPFLAWCDPYPPEIVVRGGDAWVRQHSPGVNLTHIVRFVCDFRPPEEKG